MEKVSFKNNGKLKLLIIVGTRPEIIRLAALVDDSSQPDDFRPCANDDQQLQLAVILKTYIFHYCTFSKKVSG